jgi:hypothetical protein
VFRWVGVAAPAQRCVRDVFARSVRAGTMAQRVAATPPRIRRAGRGCPAGVRSLWHIGSVRTRLGLGGMAVPPLDIAAASSASEPVRQPPVTARPRCRRSLEDALCFWFYGASGKRRWQVPESNDKGMYHRHNTDRWDLGAGSGVHHHFVEGSDLPWPKSVARRFAVASSAPCFEDCAPNEG